MKVTSYCCALLLFVVPALVVVVAGDDTAVQQRRKNLRSQQQRQPHQNKQDGIHRHNGRGLIASDYENYIIGGQLAIHTGKSWPFFVHTGQCGGSLSKSS